MIITTLHTHISIQNRSVMLLQCKMNDDYIILYYAIIHHKITFRITSIKDHEQKRAKLLF